MLTDLNVRGAKPKSKNYKLFDQRGLFLLITPTGCRYWRLRFQIDNVQREMALGQYPEMTLAQARLAQADLRSKIKVGVDPLKEREEEVSAVKAAERLKNDTFGKAVENYFGFVATLLFLWRVLASGWRCAVLMTFIFSGRTSFCLCRFLGTVQQ